MLKYDWWLITLSPRDRRVSLSPAISYFDITSSGDLISQEIDLRIADIYNLPPEKYERFVRRYFKSSDPHKENKLLFLTTVSRLNGIKNSLRKYHIRREILV